MKIFNNIHQKIYFGLIGIVIFSFLSSCSGGKFWDPADARKVSPNANERVKKNLEEGKGISFGKLMDGGSGTTYQFASSNPMWRATLELLEFLPLANVY